MELISHKVTRTEQPTDQVALLTLVPEEGQVVAFAPGQFVPFGLVAADGSVERVRPFTIASSPTTHDHIELAVKRAAGVVSNGSFKLKVGDRVAVGEPRGRFIFEPGAHNHLVFLAGGIGVVPYMSFVRFVAAQQLSDKMTLLYSNATRADIVYEQELLDLAAKHKNVKHIFTLTKDAPKKWDGETRRIDVDMLRAYVPDISEADFYLCGSMRFIRGMRNALETLGIEEDRVHLEAFYR